MADKKPIPYVCTQLPLSAPCRDFTPSYELDYDAYNKKVQACEEAASAGDNDLYEKMKCKREAHVYLEGGRRQQRYTQVYYPYDANRGGPTRQSPDQGESGRDYPSERTLERWETRGPDLARRTQPFPELAQNNPGPSLEQKIQDALIRYVQRYYPDAEWPYFGQTIVFPTVPYPLLDVGMPKDAAILISQRIRSATASVESTAIPVAQQIRSQLGQLNVLNEGVESPNYGRLDSINAPSTRITKQNLDNLYARYEQKTLFGTLGSLGIDFADLRNNVGVPTYVRAFRRDVESPLKGKVEVDDILLSVENEGINYPIRSAVQVRSLLRTIKPGSEIQLLFQSVKSGRSYSVSSKVVKEKPAASDVMNADQVAGFLNYFYDYLVETVEEEEQPEVVLEFVFTSARTKKTTPIEVVITKREHSIFSPEKVKPEITDYRTLRGVSLQQLPRVVAGIIRKDRNAPPNRTKLKRMFPSRSNPYDYAMEELKLQARQTEQPVPIPGKPGRVFWYSKTRKAVVETTVDRAKSWMMIRETAKRTNQDQSEAAKEAAKRLNLKLKEDCNCPPCPPCAPCASPVDTSSVFSNPSMEPTMFESDDDYFIDQYSKEPYGARSSLPVSRRNPDTAVLSRAHQLIEEGEGDLGTALKNAWDDVYSAHANPRKSRRSRKGTAAQRAQAKRVVARALQILTKTRCGLKGAVDRAFAEVTRSKKRARRNGYEYDTTAVRTALAPMRSNPLDPTAVRSALSRPVDYRDPTAVRTALMNPEEPFSAYDPEYHPVYSQQIGQFSVTEAQTHGIQPRNRRNPRKSRNNPEYSDYSVHHPVFEQEIGQFSTSLPQTKGIQPVNRRNPRNSKKNPEYSDYSVHHPVFDYEIGQFSTSLPHTAGIQPVNRRNPASALENGRKRRGGVPGAAEAMELYHSGEASSLKEAWSMVRDAAHENPNKKKKKKAKKAQARHNVDFQVARFPSTCAVCGDGIDRGEEIVDSGQRGPRGGVLMAHANCGNY